MLAGEQRFHHFVASTQDPEVQLDVFDFDQRLVTRLVFPRPGEIRRFDRRREACSDDVNELALEFAELHLSGFSWSQKTICGVQVGEVVAMSGKHFSLDEYQPPSQVGTIPRTGLIELDHFKKGVDLCVYMSEGAEEQKIVFKYHCLPLTGVREFWNRSTSSSSCP